MGSLKELAIPPPKIDLQYSLHFWSYKVMYGCIQVPVCVWWQLGKKRFYIRPSQRVSVINLFWGFLRKTILHVPVRWSVLFSWNATCITSMLRYHDNVGISITYINVLFDVLLFVIVLIIIEFTVEMKFSI